MFKLIFFNYLRKIGYDPEKMLKDELNHICDSLSPPEKMGDILLFHHDLLDMDLEFKSTYVCENYLKWKLGKINNKEV